MDDVRCSSSPKTHAFAHRAITGGKALTSGTQLTPNWGGYVVNNTSHLTQLAWTVPTVSLPPNSTYGWSGIWSGIGGGTVLYNPNIVEGGPLIQTGTAQNIGNCYGNPCYYFWFEIVGGNKDTGQEQFFDSTLYPNQISSGTPPMVPTVNPGDSVASVVGWIPQSSASTNAGYTVLSIFNYTHGYCIYVETDKYSLPPDNTTEWIVEAPTDNATEAIGSLANFGAVNLKAATWSSTFTIQDLSNNCSTCAGKPVTAGVSPLALNICLAGYVNDVYQCTVNSHGALNIITNTGLLTNTPYNSSNFSVSYIAPTP